MEYLELPSSQTHLEGCDHTEDWLIHCEPCRNDELLSVSGISFPFLPIELFTGGSPVFQARGPDPQWAASWGDRHESQCLQPRLSHATGDGDKSLRIVRGD